LDGARELFEYQVLILHLSGEFRRLEQALAVPYEGRRVGGNRGDRGRQPLVQERHIATGQKRRLDLVDLAVVLGVGHVVHGGQAPVLVDAAVTRHVVRGQQLVVIEACTRRIAGGSVRVGQERNAEVVERVGAVRNVDEELVAGAQGANGG